MCWRINKCLRGGCKALYKSFFELYPQYARLKNALTDYPELSREIGRHERVRRLLVSILNKK
nr:YxiJ family protein [Bacillus velezensis]